MTIRSCVTVVVFLCLVATLRAETETPAEGVKLTPEELRNGAVERARSGDYSTAINILDGLFAAQPDNVGILHDLVIIQGWAEQDGAVLALADKVDPAGAPASVLETIAKAARNSRKFELSVHWYQLAISNYPERLESRIGLALAYADWGRPDTALQVLGDIPIDDNNRTRIVMTRAYVYRADGEYIKELATYDEILSAAPEQRDALRGKAQAMQRLLMPQQALELASRHPDAFSEEEIGQLRTDWAAVQIRWANQVAVPETQTDHPLDKALEEISENSSQFADSEVVRMRTQFDRVAALRSRRRMAEAVYEFEQIDLPLRDIPAYVLDAAAGAYLYLRQPERAYELLQVALQQEPNSFRLNHDMFYVHIDLEQYRQALDLAEKLRVSEPVWKQVPGSKVVKSNALRMRAEITAGLSLAFADQLPESQARFEDLLARAPHNTDVRMELAGVFRQRGWTDRALHEYQQILAVEPDLVGAGVGHAHALLDQRQYEFAYRRISTLVSTKPTREDVMRLQKRWERHNRHYYSVNTSFGESTGSQFGNKQYQLDGYFRTKPIAYRLRPFAHLHQAFAEFPEGDSTRRRFGAGLEYRSSDWIGSMELTGGRGDQEIGASGQVEWFASDAFSLAALLETQSNTVPLRGHRVGVDVNRAGLRAAYRANESRRVSLSGDLMQFSDGNTRNSWLLSGSQRVVTRATYKLNLDGEVFASNSSKQDVAYFNPSQDASVMLTANNIWRTYRRYDFVFTQQFNAGYGLYQQESYGTNPVGFLQYLASVDINDGLDFRAGIRRARNVYDGAVEYGTFFTLGIGGSF
jgi:biofilm PGA synthesis protein PgaA